MWRGVATIAATVRGRVVCVAACWHGLLFAWYDGVGAVVSCVLLCAGIVRISAGSGGCRWDFMGRGGWRVKKSAAAEIIPLCAASRR